ncbi:hypothetical protein [Candidatus Hakubella thermalkaliphila]
MVGALLGTLVAILIVSLL